MPPPRFALKLLLERCIAMPFAFFILLGRLPHALPGLASRMGSWTEHNINLRPCGPNPGEKQRENETERQSKS